MFVSFNNVAGSVPAILSTAPAGAVYYGVYDLLKQWRIRKQYEEADAKGTQLRVSAK